MDAVYQAPEHEYTYNEAGQLIYFKSADGKYECWRAYDEQGRDVSWRVNDGYQENRRYSADGMTMWLVNNLGYKCVKEFYPDGNLRRFWDNCGREECYDARGGRIKCLTKIQP